MDTLTNFALNVLATAGVSAALLAVLGWLLRTWIGERLRASIKHEYDERLEILKAELKREGDSNLAELKSEVDRQADKLRISSASFSEVQKAVIVRKIQAVDVLWLAVLEGRALMPAPIVTSDVLTRSELLEIYSGPLGSELRAVEFGIITKFFAKVQDHRPFLGEVIWAQFATFHGMLARIIYLFREGKSAPEELLWYEDETIQRMVAAMLGDPLLQEFRALRHSRLQWLRGQFDRDLFKALDQLLSGREFGEAALKHAESALTAASKAAPNL